jgi:F420-dependent oxidoreductase-like protein
LARVSFGVFLPFYAFQNQTESTQLFSQLQGIVQECERLGYDTIWLDDHVMYRKTPLLECWTTLSALASVTSKIRLGTMVTSNAFRNPALLAKMAATVDVISNGRLEFGIGAGVQREEHEAYGYPFPKPSVRIERLAESLQVIKEMWTKEKANYAGKHFRVQDAVCEPKAVQKPHPPVTVGGCGEKYTLKITAQYADRFDFGYLPTLEEYERKLQVLKAHCVSVGRDLSELEKSCWPAGQIILAQNPRTVEEKIQQFKPKSVSCGDFLKYTFAGTPGEFEVILQAYVDLGVTHFMLFFPDLPEPGSLRLFAETVGKKTWF